MKSRTLIWILAISALTTVPRLFEDGLSIDAPLYAHLARTIARTNEWLWLHGNIPEMDPFVEHPHLGIWFFALFFKAFGIHEWAGRLTGITFYLLFLTSYFFYLTKRRNEKVAALTLLLLFFWVKFARYFSNIYLDPSALFFGSAAVFLADFSRTTRRIPYSLLSGFLLGLCFMCKGLTVLGFVPIIIWFLIGSPARLMAAGLGFAGVLGLYELILKSGPVPDFLERYWHRQWTNRFGKVWRWKGLYSSDFWFGLSQDSLHLAPFALVSWAKRKPVFIPTVLFFSFVFIYAPAGRIGNNYWVMLFPWLAWILAELIEPLFIMGPEKPMTITTVLALIALAALSALPISTSVVRPPEETNDLLAIKNQIGAKKLIVDTGTQEFNFTFKDLFVWYVDLPADHVREKEFPPSAVAHTIYLLYARDFKREAQLRDTGWCRAMEFSNSSIWLSCQTPALPNGPEKGGNQNEKS